MPGWVALVWNERDVDSTPFLRGYEAMLRTYSEEYAKVNHKDTVTPEHVRGFLGPDLTSVAFPNVQHFDWDGVLGRTLSSSYVPEPGAPGHAPLVARLRELFEANAVSGRIVFPYTTRLYFAKFRDRG